MVNITLGGRAIVFHAFFKDVTFASSELEYLIDVSSSASKVIHITVENFLGSQLNLFT